MDPANRPKKYQFVWVWGELSGEVFADDKSAARGIIKRDLGLPKNKRLPKEMQIERHLNISYYQGLQQSHANITQTSDGQTDSGPADGSNLGGID